MDQITNFLAAERPDILFLQEAYAGRQSNLAPRFRSVSVLTSLFPAYDFDFASVYCDTRRQEGEIEEGQLLLSKFPITFRDNIFFDLPYAKLDQDGTTDFSHWPATLQHCRAQIDNQEVDLLNVHGPVNLDGSLDTERRLKMSQDIIERITNRPKVILAGDFNVRPNTQTIYQIEAHLTNVFKDEFTTTFNMKQKSNPGYASSVVDMMFVSASIKVLEHHQPQVDVSDHLPLITQLEL
jgi:endonuclease/exonuclease/phosphatase family metal-dependent hydrolase